MQGKERTMPFVERMIQRIGKGKRKEAMELEKRFDALEKRQGGIPTKRRYRPVYGNHESSVFIWEREWPDLATLEAKYMEELEPELKALHDELMEATREVYESHRMELYWVVELEDD
jgi:hypothetical protein